MEILHVHYFIVVLLNVVAILLELVEGLQRRGFCGLPCEGLDMSRAFVLVDDGAGSADASARTSHAFQ
jgi:hypothetical protein